MCGIAGFVNRDGVAGDRELLARMTATIAHRGPDGEGHWIDGPVGLGFRRLAIIDVDGGSQPMANEDGSVWVAFNGEIYNDPALRARLKALGHTFRTECDTESLVHLYEEHGPDFARHLNGMFALAIWDAPRRRLILARDRMGQKPLYYCRDPRRRPRLRLRAQGPAGPPRRAPKARPPEPGPLPVLRVRPRSSFDLAGDPEAPPRATC